MKTEAYKGALVMREDAQGQWHYFHFPERRPLTAYEMTILENTPNTRWILISYPRQK